MIRRLLPIALVLTYSFELISCSNILNKQNPSSKEYTTITGKTIVITETHPVGISLSTIAITSKDFEHNIQETIEDVDPITDIFIADLDENEYDEIYIITTSVGSGSYGNVIGFASNKDKSLSRINFSEVNANDPTFKGYLGHDEFSIVNQKITRIFPIYEKEDTHQKPTGGMRKLIYGLYPGEAMWQLKIENIHN